MPLLGVSDYRRPIPGYNVESPLQLLTAPVDPAYGSEGWYGYNIRVSRSDRCYTIDVVL